MVRDYYFEEPAVGMVKISKKIRCSDGCHLPVTGVKLLRSMIAVVVNRMPSAGVRQLAAVAVVNFGGYGRPRVANWSPPRRTFVEASIVLP